MLDQQTYLLTEPSPQPWAHTSGHPYALESLVGSKDPVSRMPSLPYQRWSQAAKGRLDRRLLSCSPPSSTTPNEAGFKIIINDNVIATLKVTPADGK